MEIIGKLDVLHLEAEQELHNVLTIDFEDLLMDPVEVTKLVSEFIGRPFDVKVVQEYLTVVHRDKAASSMAPAASVTGPSKKKVAVYTKKPLAPAASKTLFVA